MLRKLIRFALSFSLFATLLVGISVTTISPAQAVSTCATGGACVVGDTGPGGGKVFYVSPSPTTFSCGPTMNLTCSYLEAAPKTWSGGTSDPTAIWAAHDYNPTGQSTYEALSASSLGLGYQHSISILTLEASTVAAGIARSYRGGGKIDWYLPATAELNLLCQLARGVSQNVNNACTGGTSSADFNAGGYWATSGYDSTKAWTQNFANGTLSGQIKGSAFSVRPIRAFGAAPAKVDQATLTVNSKSGTFGSTVTLTSSGGSGTGSVTFATTSTSCSITGTTLSVTAAVTCAVVATKAADASYNAISSASVNIVFDKALPSVSLQYPNSNTVTYSSGGTFSPDSYSRTGSGTISFSTTSSSCSIDSVTAVISILGTGYCDAYINVAEDGNYSARSSYTRVTISAIAGLPATFDTATATAGGFTINISNYSADYAFTATVDTGTVTVGVASGSTLPLTVTGLAPGESATISVVSTRLGYTTVSTMVAGSAISNKTVTYKSNYSGGAADTTQISNIEANLTAVALTRANFTFTGWNSAADGTGAPYVNGATYSFGSDLPLFAQWVQNSLVGVSPSDLTLVGSITAAGIDSTFTGSTGGSTVSVQYLSGGLPTGTVIKIQLLSNTARAASLITSTSTFILSFIVSWLAPDGTVPPTASGKAISMTISNPLIKKGASVYSVIGNTAQQVGTATSDGSVTIPITEDPEIVIAIKKPDAPTDVIAIGGADASAQVTWTAPANNGGAEITSYLVTSSGGQTCSPTSLATLICSVL